MIGRRIAIRRSLHRHALIMGGERDLVMFSALISIIAGAGGMTIASGLAAGAFWIASLFALRRMAKADPMMSRVWMRHVKQQDFYPARTTPWRNVQ